MTKVLVRFFAVLGTFLLVCGLGIAFCGCKKNSGKINVVCTVFPQYDWAKNLAKGSEKLDVDLIVKNGSDLHSYFSSSPNWEDTFKIKNCDVLICCGGESEETVKTLLSGSGVNKNMVVINLLEILENEEKALLEEDGDEFDEHVWLSLDNAMIFVDKIAEVFKTVDSEETSIFDINLESYKNQISLLNTNFKAMADSAKQKAETQRKTASILIADRFPFAYLVHDLKLNHKAAFSGCSAETQASQQLTLELANFADNQGLDTILILENGDTSLANAVKTHTQTANITKILEINSIQSVTAHQIKAGTTYLGIMESNFDVLSQALSYLN